MNEEQEDTRMPNLENQHPLIAEMLKILTDNDFSEVEAKTLLKAVSGVRS